MCSYLENPTIRASEFYDEEGRIMVRVLLSSVDAVSEDLEKLKSIKWKAVVIDECQQSGISNALEQIKSLSMDSAILLVNGQITDTTSVKILSLLEPHGDLDKLRGLKPETNDNLCKLKDRLPRFIAYGRTFQTSKFTEYWIPVQISKFQLEQYCYALLTNSIPLSSISRNDSIGALQDILLTVRKCCSHPYLLDASVQERLIAEGCLAPELLDIGIKASGKLKLLDMMLTEIKALDLNVLIIFQQMGAVGSSTGDILDDFLRQRFGPNTYERVDAGINPSKKQAAVIRFNKKENGQFVFLLENRACSSMIKLSQVDVVVIYDSDWNPSTDLRALQKISIDSKAERIKVLRLYSSFTIEEKALVLAKQNLNLDNHLHNVSRATSETLLSWGATYLFSKLDEYHADSESDLSSEQEFFDTVTKEFQSILSDNYESTNSNSFISEAKLGVGSYSTNIPVLSHESIPTDVPSSHDRSLCSNQAEHGIAGVLSHQPISQSGENLEMNSNQFAIGLVSHGYSAESSAILQNGVAVPRAVVSPLEPSNRAIPQLDINAGNLHRQFLARQPTAANSAPPLLTDSLQNELRKLEKSHEDMVSKLKTDCEKEIEELISQIRKKYEVKRQETDAVFKLKRNELDKNLDKVSRNKILAKAFGSKCLDLCRHSGVPVPSNLTKQQLHQSAPNRHSPGPSGSQPASPMQREPARSMQQQSQSRVHPSRHVPVATQSVAPTGVAAARPIHSAAASTPPNPRPLVINAISPAVATTNPPRVGAVNNHCSMPPHLQPFRPSTTPPPTSHSHLRPASTPPAATSPSMSCLRPSSTPPATSPSVFQFRATQMLTSQPRPPQLHIPNLITAELQRGMRAPPSYIYLISSPTMQGPMDARVSSSIPEQRPTSLLPDTSSTFGALEVSDFEILASVQDNQTSVVAKNVVCLSDDDN